MMAQTANWPGNTNYLDLSIPFTEHARIIVTVDDSTGNVNAWSSYESTGWRIYVSDSSFTGKVSYLII